MKDKVTAALLAFTLGMFGVHRFYLGEAGGGCAYLFFSMFLLPITFIVALIEGIMYLMMSQEEFDARYNRHFASQPRVQHSYERVVVRRFQQPDGSWVTVQETVTGSSTPRPQPQPQRPVDQDESVPQGRPAYQESPRQERRDAWRHRRPRNLEERERFVLLAAKELDGMLTPSDLALNTQLSLREAKEALDELHSQGVCDMDVDQRGVVLYSFPDFAPQDRMSEAAENLRRQRMQSVDIDLDEQ